MKRTVIVLVLALSLFVMPAYPAHADAPTNKGLLISPLRQYVSLNAGTQKSGTFTVANLTDKSIDVSLLVKQFSVSDYSYNYKFSDTINNWVSLGVTQTTLKPYQSQSIPYQIAVPPGSAGGGLYYTLFASSNVTDKGVASTIQATTLLYVTVNGNLIRTSTLVSSSIPRFVFSNHINYTVNVKNTGNTHYFANFSGQLHGLFVRPAQTGNSHLLLPSTIRKITGSIATPPLPGIYEATYGYKTDADTSVYESRLIIFIPPWSVAFVLAAALFGSVYLKRKKPTPKTEEN